MMTRTPRRLTSLVAVSALLSLPASAAAATVVSARGSTRTSLRTAFVRQDGSRRGITGEYVISSSAVVCQRTPDAGMVRFLFSRSGRSWRYRFATRGTRRGTSTQRALERACR